MTIDLTRAQINKITAESNPHDLDSVKSFLLFVGHAHSGHSIIGAILDAHPLVAIANEVNIVKAINTHNLETEEVMAVLLKMSIQKAQAKNWLNSEYKHSITNSHQGLTTQPVVIGDKKAGGTTRIIHKNPKLYQQLLRQFKQKLKIIFVRRTPLDIVASYAYYMNQKPSQFHVTRYIENMETVQAMQKITPDNQWLTINQKSFLNHPTNEINNAFKFLNLTAQPEYVSKWTQNVNPNIKSKSSFINVPKALSNQLKPYNM